MKEAAVASQSCHVFEGPSYVFPRLSEEQVRFRREHYQRHRDWKRGGSLRRRSSKGVGRGTAIRRSHRMRVLGSRRAVLWEQMGYLA
eukprot:2566098-Pyramimonas_sp.AAC.1